jgi:formylglycine-generating enzyme required for sulfatase activity
MHGNVWEYCLDVPGASYAGLPPDGSANLDGSGSERILRGGAWSHHAAICRSAYRDAMAVDEPGWQGRVGFRVVCEA